MKSRREGIPAARAPPLARRPAKFATWSCL